MRRQSSNALRQAGRSLSQGWLPLLVALLGLGSAQAGSITLAWDPVVDPQLTGYRLSIGTASRNYSQTVDVDSATTMQAISGLNDCTTYYLAIKSLHTSGDESVVFSDEVVGFTRPSVTLVQPAQAPIGSTIQVVVEGMSFQSGAGLQFSDPAVTATSVVVESCSRIRASLSVAAGAPVGAIDVTVVNPGSVPATLTGGLSLAVITDDPPAPVDNLRRTDVDQP